MIGRLVDGRYEIRSRIARGGMATVYRALDRRLDREVAVKVMHPHLAEGVDGAQFVSRFRREARAAARLAHPRVVAVYDQGRDGDTSYLTLEFVPGTTLRRDLRRDGTLPLGRSLDILAETLTALAAAHRKGLVHRDVKPENVLLDEDGHVKVADFGLARAVTEVTSTTTGTILGTVAYLAPEVVANGTCDARTDVYAVGILAFEMLTGTLPHVGATPIQVAFAHVHDDVPAPSTVVDWIPASVDALVTAFTARNPARRPDDAAAALTMVRRAKRDLEALDPYLLLRRAEPPADFVSSDDDVLASGEVPAVDGMDSGRLDAIPTGAFDQPSAGDLALLDTGLAGGSPAAATEAPSQGSATDATATTRLVDQPTVAVPKNPVKSSASIADLDTAATGVGDVDSLQGTSGDQAAGGRTTRRRRRGLIAAIVTLVLLAAGGGGAWWWFANGPGAWTTVPYGIANNTQDAVVSLLKASDLQAEALTEYHDTIPDGTVISVEPGEGQPIRRGATVTLTVSQGIRMVTVPDGLVGMTQEDAEAALAEADVQLGDVHTEYFDDVPQGQVTAVSHEADASIPHNEAVSLTVSGGPAPVTLSQQVGRSFDAAKAALEADGLQVERGDDEHHDAVPAGQVIRQTPADGTVVHRGDTVTLTVSSGPPIVTVPNVVGLRTRDARIALENAGLTVAENRYLGGLLDTVRFQDVTDKAPKGSTVTLTIW
jgi:serine/threonine-protein kinase